MSDEVVQLDWAWAPNGDYWHTCNGNIITLAPTGRGPAGWYDVITVSIEGSPDYVCFPAYLCQSWGVDGRDND